MILEQSGNLEYDDIGASDRHHRGTGMEILENGLKRIDRKDGGYDYSAVDIVIKAIVKIGIEGYRELRQYVHSPAQDPVVTGR